VPHFLLLLQSKNIFAATGGTIKFWDVQTSDPMRNIDLAANEAPAVISATNKAASAVGGSSGSGSSANHAIRPHEVSVC
jgi:hypothetical protein